MEARHRENTRYILHRGRMGHRVVNRESRDPSLDLLYVLPRVPQFLMTTNFLVCLKIAERLGLITLRQRRQRKEIKSAEARERERLDRERCDQSNTVGARHLLGCRSDVCPACAQYLEKKNGQ